MEQNNKYEAIIYWSKDDNFFIAEVPELAGCMADGETQTHALNNVQAVINEWLNTAKSLGGQSLNPKGS